MKKKVQKLALSKETLLLLETLEGRVRGGRPADESDDGCSYGGCTFHCTEACTEYTRLC
jgi:hypothetical protein